MRKLIASILTLLFIIGLNGCSDKTLEKSPIKIEAKALTGNMFGITQKVPIVEITSLVDEITITDVIANNGNCKMTVHRQKEFPKTLGYGEKATAGYSARCNLIKVEVITDQGSWSVEY